MRQQGSDLTKLGLLILLCLPASMAHAQWRPLNPVVGVRQQPQGVLFAMQTGVLQVEVCNDSVIHVVYSPTSSFPAHHHYAVIKTHWRVTPWTMQSTDAEDSLATSRLKVVVTRKDGTIIFRDATGRRLFQDSGRT